MVSFAFEQEEMQDLTGPKCGVRKEKLLLHSSRNAGGNSST